MQKPTEMKPTWNLKADRFSNQQSEAIQAKQLFNPILTKEIRHHSGPVSLHITHRCLQESFKVRRMLVTNAMDNKSCRNNCIWTYEQYMEP